MTDNPPIKTYVNKRQNIITLKVKTGYYIELLTFETMKSHRSTNIKITTNENDKNVSPLETTKVVLVHRVIF